MRLTGASVPVSLAATTYLVWALEEQQSEDKTSLQRTVNSRYYYSSVAITASKMPSIHGVTMQVVQSNTNYFSVTLLPANETSRLPLDQHRH